MHSLSTIPGVNPAMVLVFTLIFNYMQDTAKSGKIRKHDNFNYSSYIWSRAIYKEVFDINNVAIINIGGRMYSCK